TAFHPETDGQTERTNRTVEQILRIFIDYRQTNWDSVLPLIEFVINNQRSATTGHSPFFLNTGQHPMVVMEDSNIPRVQQTIEAIRSALVLAKDVIRQAQDRQMQYANSSREDKTFNVNDFVWLDTEHITEANQHQRPSRKLAPRWAGPYKILEKIGPV